VRTAGIARKKGVRGEIPQAREKLTPKIGVRKTGKNFLQKPLESGIFFPNKDLKPKRWIIVKGGLDM